MEGDSHWEEGEEERENEGHLVVVGKGELLIYLGEREASCPIYMIDALQR